MKENRRILIVEDNQNDLELIKREIKQVLSSCEFASTCEKEEFLKLLAEFSPDIVVSDFSMPSFNGLDVIRLTRQHASLTPVIICTGSIDEETAAETVKAGAVDYVIKERIVRLNQAVLHALEKKQMWMERIEAAEKLRRSEERYRLISSVSSDYMYSGLIGEDGSMELDWVAGAFEKITGYTVDDYKDIGGWRATLFPEDAEIDSANFRKLQSNQRVDSELRMVRKSGEVVWVRVYIHPVWDVEKKCLTGFFGAVQDINERKKAENEIRELNRNLNKLVEERTRELQISNKTKDKFFSIISHDLKNPFSGILFMTDVLIKYHDKYDREKIMEQILNIRSTAERGYKLLEDLLSWALSQTGNMRIIPKKILLKKLADECIGVVSGHAGPKHISLYNNVRAGLSMVSDEDVLKDILRNLLVNAVKFTRESGSVTVEAAVERDMVIISVADTGVGMSAETVNNLFRIERKMPSTQGTARETGTGLGLILCAEFVAKLGGTIKAESTPGKGSTFTFTVPVNISKETV